MAQNLFQMWYVDFPVMSNLLFSFKTIGLCKKMLEAMIMAEHEGNVYCKQCYARKFGIRGVGFGVGAGALGMDTGDRFGNTESLSYVNICISLMFRS